MSKFDEQLSNPQHVYLKMDAKRYFSHAIPKRIDPEEDATMAALHGKPVRFSRLAGESMLAWAKKIGAADAKLVPCE